MREYRFDVARVVCMTYLVAFTHLYAYIYPLGRDTYYIPACVTLTDSCLGLFTFISGYLLGRKYLFGKQGNTDVWIFYKKRLLRIYPLFFVSSIMLWIIGFNDMEATINGLLGISPFVHPSPRTLWYIPVILWCYLITPLISRHSMKWRIYTSVCLLIILCVARMLFASVDSRLIFNMFFYLIGMNCTIFKNWRCSSCFGPIMQVGIILLFVFLIHIGLYYSFLKHGVTIMPVGGVGVLAILFICEGISKMLFNGYNVHHNRFKVHACQIIGVVSYASMACYMFHRFFYWGAERIWNPSDTSVKWLFMIVIVYPVIVMLSYAIQKLYDNLVKR